MPTVHLVRRGRAAAGYDSHRDPDGSGLALLSQGREGPPRVN